MACGKSRSRFRFLSPLKNVTRPIMKKTKKNANGPSFLICLSGSSASRMTERVKWKIMNAITPESNGEVTQLATI